MEPTANAPKGNRRRYAMMPDGKIWYVHDSVRSYFCQDAEDAEETVTWMSANEARARLQGKAAIKATKYYVRAAR